MYKPGLLFDRTPEEMRDLFKSWERSDQAFFAAGACHILADLFLQLHTGEDYELIHLKPADGQPGNHVYVAYNNWAFDHNGWTKETELLATIEAAYVARYPGWTYERRIITENLETFCKENNHKLPWQYAHLPWERAYNYLKQFSAEPPETSV